MLRTLLLLLLRWFSGSLDDSPAAGPLLGGGFVILWDMGG